MESSSGLDFHSSARRSILIVSSLSCLLHYGKKSHHCQHLVQCIIAASLGADIFSVH